MTNAILIADHKTGFVSRADVCAQVAPEPTRTWNPISHRTMLEWVEDALAVGGWRIKAEEHTLSHQGETWFGVFDIDRPLFDGVSLACGVRNNTGKKLSGQFLAGRRVFICANLEFDAEILAVEKHYRNIHQILPPKIHEAVGELDGYCQRQGQVIGRMKELELDKDTSNSQLIEMADSSIISWSDIGKVKNIYDKDDRWGEAPSIWRLHNSVTSVLQRRLRTNAPSFADRTTRLNSQMSRLIERISRN